MPWVIGISTLASAAYADSQKDSGGGGDALGQQQAAIGADQWRLYKQNYQPRETQFLNTVFDSARAPAAEAARAGAEASGAADNAEQIGLRNARRSGVNINSPAFAALTRKSQADRAGLVSAAKTYGRRYANETNFNQQLSALGLGRNLATNAVNANSSAAGILQNQQQLDAENDAAQGELYGQAAGYIGSGLSDYLKGRKKTGDGLDYILPSDMQSKRV